MASLPRSALTRLILLAAAALLAACSALPGAVPTPTATHPADAPPTATATASPSPSPTATPTEPLPPTPTSTPTDIPIGRGNIDELRPSGSAGAGALGQLALSPDGTTIAVAGSQGVWLFDRFTLDVRFHLTNHAGGVNAVAWSPDGARLASGGADGTVRIWEIDLHGNTPPRQAAVLVAHAGPVHTVTWSPNGERIATGGEDHAIQVWGGADFTNLISFFHTSPIQDLDWHTGSELLLIGEFDGSISIVNTTDGSTAASFFFHDGWVSTVRWSPDGSRILTGGLDRRLVFWRTGFRANGTIDLEVEFEVPTLFSIGTAFWSADGAEITAAGGVPYAVQVFSTAAPEDDTLLPEPLRSYEGHTGVIAGLAPAGGGVLLTSSQDNTLRAWDLDAGVELRSLPADAALGFTGALTGLAWSPDGDRVATSGEDGMLRTWDAQRGALLWAVQAHTGSADSVSWSAGGDWIATGGTDNFTRVWDAATGEMLQELRSEGGRVNAVAFAPFGGQLASGGFFRIAQVWTAGTDQTPILLYPDVEITALSWASSGTVLAIGGSDGSVHLFNIPAVAEIGVLEGEHGTPIAAIAWERGGGRVAAIDRRGTVAIWDTATGELLGRHDGGGGFWGGLDWSPHGLLAAGSDDGTVLFLDASTLAPIAVQAGHAGSVAALGFSPGGQRLASADADGLVRFWGLAGPAEPLSLSPPESGEPGAMPGFTWPPAGGIDLANAGEVKQLAVIGRGTALGYDSTEDYIAVAGSTGVWIYDRETREPVRFLEGGRAFGAAFSPDGRYLAARELQLIRVWDVERAVLLRAIPVGLGTRAALAWSPDGGFFAAGERNGVVSVYSLVSGRTVMNWDTGTEVTDLAWSPEGRHLAAAAGNVIFLWELALGSQIAQLDAHTDIVQTLDFHPSEPLLLSGGDTGTVRIWELESIVPPDALEDEEAEVAWPEVRSDELTHEPLTMANTVMWSSDGSLFYARQACCQLFIWGTATREIQGGSSYEPPEDDRGDLLVSNGSVISVSDTGLGNLAPQNALTWYTAGTQQSYHLAFLGEDAVLRTYDAANLSDNGAAAALNQGADVLAIIPGSPILTVWIKPGQEAEPGFISQYRDGWGELAGFPPIEIDGWSGVSTPDGQGMLSVAESNGQYALQVCKPEIPDCIILAELAYAFPQAPTPVRALAWSPDFEQAAAGLIDGSIAVWNVNTSNRIFQSASYLESIHALTWSPDGSLIAAAGSDGAANGGQQFIRLVDARNGRVVQELALDFAHTATALAFSPDGSLLVSGDSTGDVQIWDVETGERLADLRGHTLSVTSIAFSPDGMAIATASRDGTVRIWGIKP